MMTTDPLTSETRNDLLVESLPEKPTWNEAKESAKTVGTTRRGRFLLMARQEWFTAVGYLIADIATWVLLYGTIGYFRRDAFFVGPLDFVLVDLLTLGVLLQALYVVGGYDRNTETRSLAYAMEHILAVIGAAAVSSLLIYSAADYDQTMKPSRGVMLASFVAFIPFSLGYRRLARRLVASSTANRAFLVVGSGELAADFYRTYRGSINRQRLEFVDIERQRVGQHVAGPGSPIIEGDLVTKLTNIDGRYSGVILAERVDRLHPSLLELLVRTQFQRLRVYTLESFYETHWRHVPVHSIDPFWPLQMGFQLARTSPYHYLKRLFDLAFSSVALILSSPVIAVVALLNFWQNGRPVLFLQVRIGRESEPFTILKFRTMSHPPTDEVDDIYTREGDPRITKLGRWLRKLRLDELPQLWNVFRGDMSLIGPRAEWTKCAERYERKIPFYHFRHLVKPGITGWAQVNYPYGESDEDAIEKLKYDLYYIRHYSLKLDAMIVLKTLHVMLFGKGR
jgi:exopolysaccharide biosynthesis polyprenyl glycosylphosphotransferase